MFEDVGESLKGRRSVSTRPVEFGVDDADANLNGFDGKMAGGNVEREERPKVEVCQDGLQEVDRFQLLPSQMLSFGAENLDDLGEDQSRVAFQLRRCCRRRYHRHRQPHIRLGYVTSADDKIPQWPGENLWPFGTG